MEHTAQLAQADSHVSESTPQGTGFPAVSSFPIQREAGSGLAASGANTGNMPGNLRSGIESLSGQSMADVKVHYNSAKPAKIGALAYAQGNQIHLGPGQQKHLPHEAWHVVQQKQGRVKPTMQLKSGHQINDSQQLEREADIMGAKALRGTSNAPTQLMADTASASNPPIQRFIGAEIEVVGGRLQYDDHAVDGHQGTVVASVNTGFGPPVAVHLEGPGNSGPGLATLEFATGNYSVDGRGTADGSLFARAVDFLSDGIADNKNSTVRLADLPGVTLLGRGRTMNHNNGPDLQLNDNPLGAFQLNVSPTETTGIRLYNFVDMHHRVHVEHDHIEQIAEDPSAMFGPMKGYTLALYANTVARMTALVNNGPMPPYMQLVVRTMHSIARVRYGELVNEAQDIPWDGTVKNRFDAMPRSNLHSLWTMARSHPTSIEWFADTILPEKALEDAFAYALANTPFPIRPMHEVEIEPDPDAPAPQPPDLTDVPESMRATFLRMWEQQQAEPNYESVVNEAREAQVRDQMKRDLRGILEHSTLLIRPRDPRHPDAAKPTILQHTDTSMIPIDDEQGEAGVYEIRNPFDGMLPPELWKVAVHDYEDRLIGAGVDYRPPQKHPVQVL